MGILTKGIFGGFVNKTGPLVGRNQKGKNVITGLYHPSKKSRTPTQRQQNVKLALVFSFLRPIKGLLATGFKHVSRKGSAFNEALSFNFKSASVGIDGVYTMDYARVMYSKGSLEIALNPMVVLANAGSVVYSWEMTTHCQYDDEATFLIYNEDLDMFLSQIDAVKRSNCGYVMDLPPGFDRGKLHCYMSFHSERLKKVSNSSYVGCLNN